MDAEVRRIGRLIRADRKAAGMDAATLAELIGVSTGHVRNLENGHRPCTAETATALAAAFGTAPNRYLPPQGR